MGLGPARFCTIVGLIAWLAASAAPANAQDSVAEAKKLYQSADYDAALGMLDRLRGDKAASPDLEIASYRVLCLLALGRNDDAQMSIATMLRQDPRYSPSENETPPRIRNIFEDARRRLLPQIFQERYDAAKATLQRKEFQAAEEQFRSLMSLLDDQRLPWDAPRAELRVVVSGFADLARASAIAEKPPAPPPALASSAPIELAAAAPPSRIYVGGEGVVPPVAISRPLPPFPRALAILRRDQVGILEIVVNEEGKVAEVAVKKGIHAQFDRQLVETVRTWRFHPATKDGKPVSFRQTFEVKLAQ